MPFANTRFHSVGQGCFYSGEIFCAPNSDPLRLVYDCGSETAGDALEREVDLYHQVIHQSRLDVLILSHLDADHVNGLTLLLDNGLTARNVFLPYLNPTQRAVAAAAAGAEADPDYFELLADPVEFLEGRGTENIIFIRGNEDEQNSETQQDIPPFDPTRNDRDSPNLHDLEDDLQGKEHLHREEPTKRVGKGGQPTQAKLPLDAPGPEPTRDLRPATKAQLHFKTDRKPFRLRDCWIGKFFHRDDMRLPLNSITGSLDLSVRPGDSNSVQRYKRFLHEVNDAFGTLDPGRLVMAILNESDRKKLRNCYHHIRGNHNDVSLALWHGPIQMHARVRARSGPQGRFLRRTSAFGVSNGGTLLTGDLTCTDQVVDKMQRHFGGWLRESAFLYVPHHGSLHSWSSRLLAVTTPAIMPIISAGINNGYRHPHPQVIDSLENTNGGVRWFVSNEHSPVAMHVESI